MNYFAVLVDVDGNHTVAALFNAPEFAIEYKNFLVEKGKLNPVVVDVHKFWKMINFQ